MFQLIQVALACDLTRVVSIDLDGYTIPYGDFGYTAGFLGSTGHSRSRAQDQRHPRRRYASDPTATAMMKAYHTAESALLAKLLTLLDSIPESDGTTLLDNTLVLWCGEIGAHDHSLDYLPYVLIGGTAHGLNQGRYVRYPRKVATTAWPLYSTGLPHNNLFVKLANLMGVSTNTFGQSSICTGALDGLTA